MDCICNEAVNSYDESLNLIVLLSDRNSRNLRILVAIIFCISVVSYLKYVK